MVTFNRSPLVQKFTNIICSNANLSDLIGNAKDKIFNIIASLGWPKKKRAKMNPFIALKQKIDTVKLVFTFTWQFNHQLQFLNWLLQILEACPRGCTDLQKLKLPTSYIITINLLEWVIKIYCMKWQSSTIDINWTFLK